LYYLIDSIHPGRRNFIHQRLFACYWRPAWSWIYH